MKLPILNELPTSRELIDTFGGYDHNLRIGDGEFYDMANLSSDDYPVLSPRKRRGLYATPSAPQGLISKDYLCYVDGSDFVINGQHIDMGLSAEPDMCPKSLVSMGAYVIIMPDKMYINTVAKDNGNTFEFGSIEASVSINKINFHLCNEHGERIGLHYSQKDMPKFDTDEVKENSNGKYWLQFDDNEKPIALKRYSTTNDQWAAIDTYLSISTYGDSRPSFDSFEVGDSVIMSGITIDDLVDLNDKPQIIAGKELYAIWIKGIIGEPFEERSHANIQIYQGYGSNEASITVKRKIPNLDFIIESQNRLWGCRYGTAVNGEMVNEIYASKLGDFKNWQNFAGVSTDSWVAGIGTDGPFTGAVNYRGYPIFFKENCIHKVYGSYPAQYQIQTTMCKGVEKGCSKSISTINGTLFYKSALAVCCYDGSLPTEISAALGNSTYKDAIAGALGNKYYVSMSDSSGASHLFVYDIQRGLWHKESSPGIREFCYHNGNLYYVDRNGNIGSVLGDGDMARYAEAEVPWMAETGLIGTDSPDRKYISRIDLRMSLDIGSSLTLLAQYDSSGEWEQLLAMSGSTLNTFSIPVKPKRCDHMRLRFEGEGNAKIYSICKTVEQGSDI